MTRYRWAAVLMLMHGGVMEFGVFLALGPMLVLGIDTDTANRYVHFALPFLNDNLFQMMAMSGVFGAMRIIGAVGVLRNRMWGLALSVINCVVTMVLMIFVLPAGLVDGLLACGALLLLLSAYFGEQPIAPVPEAGDASRP